MNMHLGSDRLLMFGVMGAVVPFLTSLARSPELPEASTLSAYIASDVESSHQFFDEMVTSAKT